MSGSWKQRPEGGSPFAMRLLRLVACHGGRRIARLALWPACAYFMLVRGPERRASRSYLPRVLGRLPRWHEVFQHFRTFGSVILDRIFLLSGRMDEFQLSVTGVEQLREQMQHGRGVLIFGSHLGSFDALRVLAQERPDVRLRVVLDKSQGPALTELLAALNPPMDDCIIDASMDSTSVVMAIKQATDQGDLVAMLVDRVRPGDPSLPAPFLGAQAQFPTSPWLIAAVLKVPVVLAFGLYHGKARYSLAFETYSEGLDVPRRNRATILATLIGGYAQRLEHYARLAPFNWFNFYDFWNPKHAEELAYAEMGVDPDAAVQRRTAVRRTA